MQGSQTIEQLAWIGQITFCTDVLEDGATFFWLPILQKLAESEESIIYKDLVKSVNIPTRIVKTTIRDLYTKRLINYRSDLSENAKIFISEKGKILVNQINRSHSEFISKLNTWLQKELNLDGELSKNEIEEFLEYVANWGYEEAQSFFNNVIVNSEIKEVRLEVTDNDEDTDLSEKMKCIVDKLRAGIISGSVPTNLMLHSFVYWIIYEAFSEDPLKKLDKLLGNKSRSIIFDTNVLIGQIVDSDYWHYSTDEMSTKITSYVDKNIVPISLFIMDTTIEEFAYTLRKIANRICCLRQSKDKEQFDKTFFANKNLGLFIEFLNKYVKYGSSFENYRDVLFDKLGTYINKQNITYIKANDYLSDYEYIKDNYMSRLRKFEENRHGWFIDERINHKVSLLSWILHNRSKTDTIPFIWTYNKSFKNYELICLNTSVHCVDLLRLDTVLRADDIFLKGNIKAVQSIINNYSRMGIVVQNLEQIKIKAERYYNQFLYLQGKDIIHTKSSTTRMMDLDDLLIRIAEKDYSPEISIDYKNGLEFVLDFNQFIS